MKKAQQRISDLSNEEVKDFSEAIYVLTKTYDKLFDYSFPYSRGIHQVPTNGEGNSHWHMSFYPPLLRCVTVKKIMVGYEMFGSSQRDITAEIATNMLRELV